MQAFICGLSHAVGTRCTKWIQLMFLRKTDEEVPLGQHTDLWWTYIYIYIHIYTYIYIYMYIELYKIYICTMVGWDSTTNLFIYIYRIYMRSFYPRPKKKPVRWAITTITTNISYTMLYVMSSILHHLTHNVIMCYVYIYIYMESNRQQQFWLYTPLHQIYFIQI